MKQFFLSEITTKDGLVHQGLFSQPSSTASPFAWASKDKSAGKPRSKRALLWIHGLSAAFYNDIFLHETVAQACDKKGWGFAVFNNRGHDLLAGIRKKDGTPPNGYSYYPAGAGQEVFAESVLDIDAGVDFLVGKGFTDVVIVGHSTGANKACYYVTGVVLSGPMSDRLDTSVAPKKRQKDLKFMRHRISEGKGEEPLFGYHFFPITPRRYVSLFEPGTQEDTFDYGDAEPRMKYFSKIRLPLLVVLAGRDEYADRPIADIKKIFDVRAAARRYKSIIIPGALHKFNGTEKEIAGAITDWTTSL
jgi:pimeloyl-ACP methyl ester carboxylesterase